MTITFEITEETAALIWGDHHRAGRTKAQVAANISNLAKSHIEHKAARYKQALPADATRDIQSFPSLPES